MCGLDVESLEPMMEAVVHRKIELGGPEEKADVKNYGFNAFASRESLKTIARGNGEDEQLDFRRKGRQLTKPR